MEDKRKVDPASKTEDFKEQIEAATKAAAEQVAFWKEYWKVWIPGGLRKRHRYTTKPHGLRRADRRRKNKVARASRKKNRPVKKGKR